jgi:hypothetical protein
MDSTVGLSGRQVFDESVSRTGPLAVIKLAIAVSCPEGATETWGLLAGLDPPTAGCAWQLEQLVELNRGPSPCGTPSPS